MKVIIAGSRGLVVAPDQLDTIVSLSEFKVDIVVSGMATGIDRCGYVWAGLRKKPCLQFPADWNRFGRAAGPKRNIQMADEADALIAIWDRKSRGTKHMIDQMVLRNKPVYITTIEPGKHVLNCICLECTFSNKTHNSMCKCDWCANN